MEKCDLGRSDTRSKKLKMEFEVLVRIHYANGYKLKMIIRKFAVNQAEAVELAGSTINEFRNVESYEVLKVEPAK